MFPLFKGSKTFKNGLFLLKFVSTKDPNNRFCFSVSKKVAKNAVVRNRLRRAGYRLLSKYIPLIKSNTLAVFSFLTIPKDEESLISNLDLILKDSKLLK